MGFKIGITLESTIKDSRGNVISYRSPVPCHSLLKQFIQFLLVQLSQSAQVIRRTDNTTVSITPHAYNLHANPAAGSTALGILIGSGTTEVTMTDYKLEAQIITNVVHGTQAYSLENPNSATWRVVISRPFTNNTGSSFEINEVALYSYGSVAGYYYCIERTLYTVVVPPGASVTLTYLITISL